MAIGAMAWFLRLPDFFCFMKHIPKKVSRLIGIMHTIFGGLFLACCLFMPVTANWIWPRYGTPREIIYLISSMYISIVLGIVCIRVYKALKEKEEEPVEVAQVDEEPVDPVDEENKTALDPPGVAPLGQRKTSRRRLLLGLKYAHSLFMVYSWVMLLGAGQAFVQNSRTNGFPYSPGPLTDSLVGRCYARDLQSPEMPGWLLNLTCGLGVMCADAS